jgi:hypothetical protein
MSDQINAEIDRRKIQKLVDNSIITESDLQNAEIVFTCSCGYEQSIDNNTCESCGKRHD